MCVIGRYKCTVLSVLNALGSMSWHAVGCVSHDRHVMHRYFGQEQSYPKISIVTLDEHGLTTVLALVNVLALMCDKNKYFAYAGV